MKNKVIKVFNQLDCPTYSNSNYRVLGLKCYFFESSKKTYQSAQSACNSRFGSSGEILAEPRTTATYASIWSAAQSIVGAGVYWIRLDDLQYQDGDPSECVGWTRYRHSVGFIC